MGKVVSHDQVLQVSTRVATQVVWDDIDGDALQKEIISLTSEEFGKRFTAFLKNNAPLQTVVNYIINADTDPFVPDGWLVEEHEKMGQIIWDQTKLLLFFSKKQKGGHIEGNKLKMELEGKSVMNACVLDFLLTNPSLIPGEWKGKHIHFWGTIYRVSNGCLCVRFLYWFGGRWVWNDHWLGNVWHDNEPALLRVSV